MYINDTLVSKVYHIRVRKPRLRLLGTCSSSSACADGQKGNVTWKR